MLAGFGIALNAREISNGLCNKNWFLSRDRLQSTRIFLFLSFGAVLKIKKSWWVLRFVSGDREDFRRARNPKVKSLGESLESYVLQRAKGWSNLIKVFWEGTSVL